MARRGVLALLSFAIPALASGTGASCPAAPSTPSDRRSPAAKDTLTLAVYNLYWLFDGVNDPDFVPWNSAGEANAHIAGVAAMMVSVNADIWILVEVEDCDVLSALRTAMGEVGKEYEYYLVRGTDSFTGQDVALFTRIDPVTPLERSNERSTYPVRGTQCGGSVSGDYGVSKHFITEIEIAPGVRIGVVGLHFLARPDDQDRCRKREAQAETIRKAIADRTSGRDDIYGVVVGGDFNDFSPAFPDARGRRAVSRAVEIVSRSTEPPLREQSGRVGQAERYTYGVNTDTSLLDHLLLSPELDVMVTSAKIHRVGPDGEQGDLSTAWKGNGGSDHWPLTVTLSLSLLGAPVDGPSTNAPTNAPSGPPTTPSIDANVYMETPSSSARASNLVGVVLAGIAAFAFLWRR